LKEIIHQIAQEFKATVIEIEITRKCRCVHLLCE
jgi:hypothetical protein